MNTKIDMVETLLDSQRRWVFEQDELANQVWGEHNSAMRIAITSRHEVLKNKIKRAGDELQLIMFGACDGDLFTPPLTRGDQPRTAAPQNNNIGDGPIPIKPTKASRRAATDTNTPHGEPSPELETSDGSPSLLDDWLGSGDTRLSWWARVWEWVGYILIGR